jgi:hypothetical protein
MRSYPDGADHRGGLAAATLATAAAVALAGCSSGPGGGPASAPQPTPTGSQTQSSAAGGVGLSPNGVTTSVDAPAESTEEEYFQACHTARLWMQKQSGDPKTQLQPYLAMLQSGAPPGPGTFNTPWSQLNPQRQAAVIVAAQAAADALCE